MARRLCTCRSSVRHSSPSVCHCSPLALAFLVLLAPLLTSCLELTVAVNFRTSTAGQVQVDGLAYRLAQGLQVVEGSDRVPFPSTRAEWQAVVDQVNGFAATPSLTLVSWESTDEDQGQRTKTVLTFTNARALEGLAVSFKQKLTLLQATDGRWTLTLAPQVPRVTSGDPEARRLWTALWGTVVWNFDFTPPGQRVTRRGLTLAELAGDQPPAEWKLTW